MTRMTVAEAVIDCLLAEGINYVFNISGTQIIPILDAVDRHPKMRSVLTHHEQGAALMAFGHAHATRGPSVCMSTAGPGAVNMMAGIAAAHKDHVPVVAITGMHNLRLHHRDMRGEENQVALYQPITKLSQMASTAEKVPELLRRAFRIAMTDTPGAVHVGIPKDIQTTEIDFVPMEPRQYRSRPRMDCDLSQMGQIIELLSQARSPVILAGHEVTSEEGTSELIAVAEATGIPVATAIECDAMPYGHPLAVGSLGNAGSELAKSITKNADVMLAVGSDLDYRSTLFRFAFFSPETQIIQVSRFEQMLSKNFPAAVAVQGSSRQFLLALLDEVRAGRLPRRTIDLTARKKEWEEKRLAIGDRGAKPIRDKYTARVIREILPDDAILVSDVGHFPRGAMLRQFEFRQPGTYISPKEYGGIGVGLPYALGVKLARPNQEVVLATGDGAMMFNVGELETAVRENIKITTVVYNDRGFTAERVQLEKDYGGRYFATEYGDVNFAQIATGMGAYGIRVTEPLDLPDALQQALKQDRPAVIDVVGARVR